MNRLSVMMTGAESSPLRLWWLNQVLWRMVPFNAPHRFRVVHIEPEALTVKMPFIHKNFNHIHGLHACGLATLCEYACGLHLMKLTGNGNYRLVLKSLDMAYHYQGKQEVTVRFELTKKWVQEQIEAVLAVESSTVCDVESVVYDRDQHKICTAKMTWQIKRWEHVKTGA